MKNLFLIIFFYCCVFHTTAQISIINNNNTPIVQDKQKDPTIDILPYDSLQPIKIITDDIIQNRKYIGQKIFLPSSNKLKTLITTRFQHKHCDILDYSMDIGDKKEANLWTNIYKPQNKCIADKNKSNNLTIQSSINDSICNRYYTIIDILNDAKSNSSQNQIEIINTEILNSKGPGFQHDDDRYLRSNTYKLKDDIRGDTVYSEENDYISLGYYMKLKEIYEGKNMVWYLGKTHYNSVWELSEETSDEKNEITDYINSKTYKKKDVGSKFKCIAIKLYNGIIVAQLKGVMDTIVLNCPNNLTRKDYVHEDLFGVDDFTMYIMPKLHSSIGKFILEEDVNTIEKDKEYIKYKKQLASKKTYDPKDERLKECVNLYGKKNGTLVANYTVALGMTRAMCESAGLSLQLSTSTKKGKNIVMKSYSQTAVLVNGVVTKIYEY